MKAFITLIASILLSCIHLLAQGQNADFISDTTQGCAPVTIKFQNTSIGNNVRYRWSFGNGNYSSLENPQAIFYIPGTYEVSLTVTDSAGNISTQTKSAYIRVFKNPIAEFSAIDRKACIPFNTNFNHKVSKGDAPISQYIWDFGDGNTKKDSNPNHTYNLAGDFTVSLLVVDQNNCESKIIKTDYISVLKTPIIKISADKSFYCESPVEIQFTDNSLNTSSTDSYLWEFGDGDSSTQKNPKHTYKAKGNYTVILTITKANGCSASKTFVNYIKISPLIPDFKADITAACNPATISFENLTEPTTRGVSFRWDFGDGQAYGGLHTVHTYTTAGIYTVKLTATVDADCKASTTKTAYIKIEESPNAKFSMTDSISCKKPLTVLLTNNSTNTTSIDWVVNNESLGSSYQVGATFTNYGHYKARLIASNIIGCKDTLDKNIIIKPIEIDLRSNIYQGCVPLEIVLSNHSEPFEAISSYLWTFGDGNDSTTSANSCGHTYSEPGIFMAKLKIISANGCIAEDSVKIVVGEKTNPAYLLGTENVCNNEKVFYTNTTSSDSISIDSTIWKIGKGSDFSTFSYGFDGHYKVDLDSGWYDVMLITVNNGCRDTFLGEDQLFVDPPHALISAREAMLCTKDPVILRDVSTGADSTVWHVYHPIQGLKEILNGKTQEFDSNYHNHFAILIAYNFTSGCIDSTSYLIEFPKSTTVALLSHSTDYCAPSSMLFFAGKVDGSHDYIWRTDDTVGTGSSFELIFENAGEYAVTLIVANKENKCVDSITEVITINGPIVNGEVKGPQSCAPVDVQLRCTSDPDDFKEIYWLVDNQKIQITDTGTLTHTFYKPGEGAEGQYLISLIGVDSNGCVGQEDFPFKVDGVFNAKIKIRRFTNCDGNEFIFQLVAPEYNLNSLDLLWDFDDGTTGTRISEYKLMPKSGIYDVTLTITEPNGCVTVLHEIIDIKHEKLFAQFDADSLETACPPLFVQFKNFSTSTNRNIVKYHWDFGDGSVSAEKNPSKLYLKAGTFTVSLIIEDEWGCIDSAIYKDFVLVNGPTGSYNFDKKEGCVPLEVSYTSVSQETNFFEWDMGDGNVIENQDTVVHTYYEPGRYIPMLILSDTFGCSYTLPPIDTIYVDPYPDPKFNYDGLCYNKEMKFWPISDSGDIEIESYIWEFIQGPTVHTSIEDTPTFLFANDVDPVVNLTATTSRGCSNTTSTKIDLYNIAVEISSNTANRCVGKEFQLLSIINSDTNIHSYKWYLPWGESDLANPIITALDTGALNLSLKVIDVLGCEDSINVKDFIIGDTINPPDIEILRTSVLNDHEIIIDFEECNLADFHSYFIYQEIDGIYKTIHQDKVRVNNSFVHNVNSTLNQSYCFKVEVQNTCGLLSDTLTINPHCTVEVGAKSLIDAVGLRWNSYTGWEDISSYEVLRENLNDANSYDLIAKVDADVLNYIDSSVHCNVLHRYKIKAIEQNGNLQWSLSDSCAASPIWTNTLKPNELIRASVVDDKYITLDWDSVPNSRMPIEKYIIEKSIDGFSYAQLMELDNNSFTAEDPEVEVDDQSYYYRSYAVDVCGDTSPLSNLGKTILLKASTDSTLEQRPMLDWSTYKGWAQGVNFYSIEIENPDGSFTEISTSDFQDTSLTDQYTNLNQRSSYCYRIIGHRNRLNGEDEVISISNVDCSPVKSLIWIPNAFSPNADNINDLFVTPAIYIRDYHIKIYNRWGELVFESFDYYDRWDGTYLGKNCQQDAYAVIVETVGVDEVRRMHAATVTLLR